MIMHGKLISVQTYNVPILFLRFLWLQPILLCLEVYLYVLYCNVFLIVMSSIITNRKSRSCLVSRSIRENDGGSNDAKDDISVRKLSPLYHLMVIIC